MYPEEIIKLARVQKLSKNEMEVQLSQFKKDNWGVLDCILFIRHNQFIGMDECEEFLFNHQDWVTDAEGYYKAKADKRQAAFGG